MPETLLRLKDLVPATTGDESSSIPDLTDFGTWAATLAREGNPWGDQLPLSEIYAGVIEAAAIPKLQPHVPSSSPMQTLDAAIRGEDVFSPVVDGRPPIAAKADNEPSPDLSETLQQLLGAEILKIAGSSALPASRRVEALERVAVALANPSQDNVRAILLALLKD